MPTLAGNKKLLKRQKLRNNEYYDMQSVFDKLYVDSLAGREFRNLLDIVTTEENIKLAYRNLKKNAGSKTPGTDGKTILDLANLPESVLVQTIQQKFVWYQPQAVKRVEIPKVNGKTRPLGIPTILDRLICKEQRNTIHRKDDFAADWIYSASSTHPQKEINQ